MNGFSKIPVKINAIGVISGVEFEVDSKGLDCIIKPTETDIWVYLKSGKNAERFLIKAGESFEFCGKIYFSASMSGTVYCYMYQRL